MMYISGYGTCLCNDLAPLLLDCHLGGLALVLLQELVVVALVISQLVVLHLRATFIGSGVGYIDSFLGHAPNGQTVSPSHLNIIGWCRPYKSPTYFA